MTHMMNDSQTFHTYGDIKDWRLDIFQKSSFTHETLNDVHDNIMRAVVDLAVKQMESERGQIPARFAFIVMGSSGRWEQSLLSDQDHGIIFDGHDKHRDYFLQLGEEIVKGLDICGYEKCEGKVMANNPNWTKSLKNWEEKLKEWLDHKSWENLRHFSIFTDARVLRGDRDLLNQLKQPILNKISSDQETLMRLCDNVQYIKKGVGMFGQLLTEQKGPGKGLLDYKDTILFPYVNSARLLAYSEAITETSTSKRLDMLPRHLHEFRAYKDSFEKAIAFRLRLTNPDHGYELIHYVATDTLTKQEKETLKTWMKDGQLFLKRVTAMLKNSKNRGIDV
ncbi:DUF294 nucleotidyltransferase-like domain-containing protein [Salipaludibacillus agaradhaerens]|nr:DUF294 nucleotidyltransferase-like domain-containing protein [Salipaludibacillus agaradhaerens]